MESTVNNLQKAETESRLPAAERQESVFEIDFVRLLRELLHRWYLILLAALICGGIAGAYYKFMVKPLYQSTSVLYIYSKETTLTSLTDLQIGSVLTEDYMVIVKSRPVMEQVVKNLGLKMSYKSLLSRITLKNPEDTRVLKITATHTDPEMAKKIADEVASVAADYISDIMEMAPPKFIETGEVPTVKSWPSTGSKALLAALLGALAVCALIVLRQILDDTIKNADDVQKYLGVPVLASVPVSEAMNDDKTGRLPARKRRRRRILHV